MIKEAETLLFLDVETGGTDPQKHSLLSIGLVVWNDCNVKRSIEILIKEDPLVVTNEALAINRIDIKTHILKAIDIPMAFKLFVEFIENNFEQNRKATLVGHNISFDIGFLREFFKKNNSHYERYFSHRSIDTSSILHFLYLSGRLKKKIVSSDAAFEQFGIVIPERHTALGDCLATVELFQKLLDLDRE